MPDDQSRRVEDDSTSRNTRSAKRRSADDAAENQNRGNAAKGTKKAKKASKDDGEASEEGDEFAEGVSDFVKKLYRMLEDPTSTSVAMWSPPGTSFVVTDSSDFNVKVLPKHFKHNNFSSFVRQLNKYDFHKVKGDDGWSKVYGSQAWEFQHPNFRRDRQDLLEQIRRKVPPHRSRAKPVNTPTNNGSGTRNSNDVSPSSQQPLPSATAMASKHGELDRQHIETRRMLAELRNENEELRRFVIMRSDKSNHEEVARKAAEQMDNNAIRQEVDLIMSQANAVNPTLPNTSPQTMSESGLLSPVLSSFPGNAITFSANTTQSMPPKTSPNIASGAGYLHPDGHVLLVDDDPVCRMLSARFLQLFGCIYDLASDGSEALEYIDMGRKYDIVLMDIVMPNIDGIMATTHIRQFDQITPIISMTSSTTERDCIHYFSSGMTDILAKPFNRDSLLKVLET
ncbi:hypothetical protein M427DRAFT_117548 [Gonapodya prolifera JEL478]|uniref:Transcription factor n=1 Tax=Gonapodya prolifera (strain JEL478) TaxID=1344416 RepID=A0A138ZXL0_GONPJ|nr:hypothetical protein M427DRAFT_117548 [Gonapodya prolifera JEL478]|eukprot:KXS09238.1 hypothetical protein M427DRAFT_117548 [Gonapodya prolifera JEL478]